MNMNRNILALMLALTAGMAANAQGTQNGLPSRSLTVEGSFNPNTGHAGKMMPVPDMSLPVQTGNRNVTYDTDSVALARFKRNSMSVFGESSNDIVYKPLMGVAQFGYGLRNVLEGSAEACWRISPNDIVTADASLDGFNSETQNNWHSRHHSNDMGLGYTHSFKKFELTVYGRNVYSRHNYMVGDSQPPIGKDSLRQKTVDSRAGVAVRSVRDVKVQWGVSASYDWLKRKDLILSGIEPDNKERILRIDGFMSMPLKGGTAAVKYVQKTAKYNWKGFDTDLYKDFSEISLTPSWSRSWGNLYTDLGVNLDARTAVGAKFLLSPEASLRYPVNNSVTLNARFDGGFVDNSAAHLAMITPYWFENRQIKDGYVIDLAGGVVVNAASAFSINAWGGFRHTKDDLFQVREIRHRVVTSALVQDNSNTFYAHADVAFVPGSSVDIKAWIDGNVWMGSIKERLMAFKPVMDAGMFAHVNIMKGLDTSLEYHFTRYAKVDGKRENPVNDLLLRADWSYNDRLSFYLKGGHLLGGNYCRWAGYNEIGAYCLAGARYTF